MNYFRLFISSLYLIFTLSLTAQEVSILVPRGDRAFEAVSWSTDGRIYTPDYISGWLFQVQLDGQLDTLLRGLQGPLGGSFDPAGNFYFSEFGAGALHRYSSEGVDSVLATDLGNPSGTYFDGANQRVLVSDYTFNRLHSISLVDGSAEVLIDSSDASGLNGPDAIVAAPNGGYLVANFNDSLIHRLDTTGEVSLFTALPASPNSGYLIPYREGYLSAGYSDHRIWFIDATGQATVWAGNGIQAFVNGNRLDTVSFSLPNGLALSPDGDSLVISENTTIGQLRLITGLNQLTSMTSPTLAEAWNFRLFPQPAEQSFTTTFSLLSPTRIGASIISLSGQTIYDYPILSHTAGDQRESWTIPDTLSPGLYFFRLRTSEAQQLTVPLVIK